ncbi:TolC family protein [Pedobacter faecalis]|uniref:TolC family protein n=1 Tax=Pedobacter faecalis TaxID=3041495 RepID=UPI00254E2333|nr:efflux transporter outer membrane subunit [Pedobacter sp. ELA7]
MKLPDYSYVFLLLLALSAGCSVSKDVALPRDAVPSTYRGAAQLGDTAGVGSLSVTDFITSAEIRRLIDTALVRNYDMQLALKNIEAADLLFRQARLGNLPSLGMQVSANSTRPSDNSLSGLSTGQFLGTRHIEDFNASLNLVWEADIWAKIKNQKQAALAGYLQSAEARKAVQTRLVANIAKGYYQLLMMDAQLEIARKNLSLNDSTLTIIKLQFEAGQVSSLAVQQAEAQRLVAAQLVPQLEQQIVIQENAIKLLTGSLPGPVERLSDLDQISIPPAFSAGLPSSMVSRRPDVKTAELSLAIANARVGISKANMYPTLSISASGGLNSLKASNWFNVPASVFGIVGGSITQPIFQRKELKTQFELAKIDREKVVIQFRQSVLSAVGEVSDELVKLEKLKDQYDISAQRAETLSRAVKNAGLLFQNGMATYLEVITAQSNALQSQLELTALKTARLNASVELYRALGGGI